MTSGVGKNNQQYETNHSTETNDEELYFAGSKEAGRSENVALRHAVACAALRD